MITVTINGIKTTFEKPVTILEAAGSAGIHIPTLCHDETLKPYGGCRLCLVEVEKLPRLQTACTQYVTDGMVVRTETESVVEARRAVLEFLLINHPLDCPYCDKAGECDLQDLAMKYGPATGRFAEGKRRRPENYDDPLIVRNMERCILCSKCVRMCDDVQAASAISITDRGSRSYVEPFSSGRYDCEYCGNCLTVCPVGAITSRLHRHAYRPWVIDKEVETICSYCGVGCSLVLQTRSGSIVRSVPRIGWGLNKGLLCAKGRFGYDYISDDDRLDTPLIRRNGELQPASWTEAIAYTAQRLKEIGEERGSDVIAGIASARCTNEDAYVFQKFFRLALGNNNVDSTASLAFGPAQRFLEKIFGQGVTASLIHGIPNSDGVFVAGGDPSAVNPVLGLQIRAAHKREVPVVVVGDAEGLRRFSRQRLIPRAFAETALLSALITRIKSNRPLKGERPFFEEMIDRIRPVSLKEASDITGIGADELSDAADTLSNMNNPSIIIGRDIVQTSSGHMNLLLLSVLVYLLNGRVYLLSELPNEQGLLDVGCQPDMLPCGRPLEIETFRKRCGEVFGGEIPSNPGLGLVEIIEAAHSGGIKALYVMGDNTALALPGAKFVKEALSNLEFLVVQDSHLTETAWVADVVLPSLAWSEKDGTYTNLERRIQFTKKAIEGKGPEDWRIIAEISKILGIDMGYKTVEDVFAEIARVSLYKDITSEDIEEGKCLWPYKGEPLRHGAHMAGIEPYYAASLLGKSDTGKVYAGRDASLFHSENSSRYSSALKSISPVPYVKMSKALAEKLDVGSGDSVEVSTELGSVRLSVRIYSFLPENVVLIPNFENGGIFEISRWSVNRIIKAPALDGNEVLIEK